jgi:hypothetical protein
LRRRDVNSIAKCVLLSVLVIGSVLFVSTSFSATTSSSLDAPLSPPTIAANPATGIVTGQSTTLTVIKAFKGGIPPYTCQWFQEAAKSASFSSLGGSFGGSQGCAVGKFPSTPTGPLSTGTWSFLLQVTDSTPAPLTSQTVESGSVNVTVGYLGIKLALSIYAIDVGQSATITANATFAGGIPLYSVTLFKGAAAAACPFQTFPRPAIL